MDKHLQWRIQDFPGGGDNSFRRCEKLLFGHVFLKTEWKWKKLKEGCVPDAFP